MPATPSQNRARARKGWGERPARPECSTCDLRIETLAGAICLAGFANPDLAFNMYRFHGFRDIRCPDAHCPCPPSAVSLPSVPDTRNLTPDTSSSAERCAPDTRNSTHA